MHDIEQFWNPRKFTDVGVEATKKYIDSIISNRTGWINLASHGTNHEQTPTIDSFRQILRYAIDQGAQCVTWKYLYDNFKSSKLEKRIIKLENN